MTAVETGPATGPATGPQTGPTTGPDTDTTGSAPGPLRKNRDFLLLWSGAGISIIGSRISTIAYPLLMIFHYHSTVRAGLVSSAALLPQLFLQLPAGVLVDRWDRRRLMISCDIAGATAIGSVVLALATGHLWLIHLMVAAFVEGGATIFYRLAERAAVRNVVHPDHLTQALSQNEARGRAAGLLGQPVGSSLFALAPWLPFLFTTGSHVLAWGGLLRIKAKFQSERDSAPRRMHIEIAESFRWLRTQRFLRAAVVLVAGSNILFQVVSLALVVIIRDGGHSPAAIGVVGVLSGIGGMLGALSGSWWMKRLPVATILLTAFGAWAVLMAGVAVTTNLLALGGLFAGMSFVGALMNVAAGVYQVKITPDGMQGRVSSLAVLMSSGANSLGAIGAGVLLTAFGTRTTVLGAGVVMLMMTFGGLATPAIRAANEILVAPPRRSGKPSEPSKPSKPSEPSGARKPADQPDSPDTEEI